MAEREGPAYVAIVTDGNGRWAKARGLPVGAGHRAGMRGADFTPTLNRRFETHCVRAPEPPARSTRNAGLGAT